MFVLDQTETTMTEQDIIAKVENVINFGNNLLCNGNNDLKVPEVRFFRGKSTAGYAWKHGRLVEFNLDFAERNPDTFFETVIHEVAHLFTFVLFPRAKQAHGPEFKRVDTLLGGRGKRGNNYCTEGVYTKRVTQKFKYSCACVGVGNHIIALNTHKKMQLGCNYRCKKCATRLTFVG